MALIPGTTLGAYEIVALIGAGGMGEVYRARDTKLGRNVAIKILPEAFAADAERLARFRREAQVLASLNHSNIGAIHGLEEAQGIMALVLELVDGETLEQRIAKGPIPIEESLAIAHRIAEALEAAHEKGIVHRDLKPANVKLTPEGKVKVLDFGLAKAIEEASPTPNALSPTLSVMATLGGVILGTAGYMSPEQARGHATDQRSDIFSFACVLYEMLTGRRAFPGETITDVIAAIVAREPDWRLIPANLHPKAEELIRRCLAKNRKDRWHAIADVRVELETIIGDPHGLKARSARGESRQPLWRRAVLPTATLALGALMAVGATLATLQRRPSPQPAIARFPLVLPEGQRIPNSPRTTIAMSPDGANIVYATTVGPMYRRNIGDMEVRSVQGTSTNDSVPFFSPDGRWLGYYSATDRSLKKIAVAGGAAVTISQWECADVSCTPVWNWDDYIYVGLAKSIMRVSANGGAPETVITLKDEETAYRPQLLPGGDSVLFTLQTRSTSGAGRLDNAQIVIQSLTSDERTVLLQGGSDGRYVPTGHLVYVVGSTLFAIAFDLEQRRVTGDPAPVIEDLRRGMAIGGGGAPGQFAFSDTGSMIYLSRLEQASANQVALTLVDRSGRRTVLDIPPGPYSNPRLSPDGKQLAVQFGEGDERDVRITDVAGGQPMRQLTFEGQSEKPLWTRERDRQRVLFTSDREGGSGLFWQWVDGGPAERFARIEQGIRPQAESWSPDGDLIFSNRTGAGNAGGGIFVVSQGANENSRRVIAAPGGNSSLSPDGRWLAHSWLDSSGIEVYVQPFPPTGEKHQITAGGGTSPLWSPDGQQVFFLRPATQQLLAVDVKTERGFRAGKITPLPIQGIVTFGPRAYDVMPDGKQFLVMVQTSQAEGRPATRDQINVTLNWFTELQQRVPRR